MSSTPTSARRMTLRQSLALVWRTLRSMRTALVLLLLLGVAAVAGSLVPQVGTSNARILAMFRDHPLRADIYDKLGLFDVFGSWWFTLIYSLLLISLAAGLFPRTRALVRNIRSRPQPSRELDGMRHYAVRPVGAEPERAITEARFTDDGDHSGVRIHVDDFTATYRIPSGIPEDFVTHADLYDASGGYVRTVDIRVNHPAEIDGVKFYQFGYGWAPVVDVRQGGEPIASGPVVCTQGPPPPGVSALQLPWNCVVKLPTLTPQVGIRFELW